VTNFSWQADVGATRLLVIALLSMPPVCRYTANGSQASVGRSGDGMLITCYNSENTHWIQSSATISEYFKATKYTLSHEENWNYREKKLSRTEKRENFKKRSENLSRT